MIANNSVDDNRPTTGNAKFVSSPVCVLSNLSLLSFLSLSFLSTILALASLSSAIAISNDTSVSFPALSLAIKVYFPFLEKSIFCPWYSYTVPLITTSLIFSSSTVAITALSYFLPSSTPFITGATLSIFATSINVSVRLPTSSFAITVSLPFSVTTFSQTLPFLSALTQPLASRFTTSSYFNVTPRLCDP